MSKAQESLRSIKHAETALEEVRKNDLPAYPKVYEVLYTHAAGLNKNIDLQIEKYYSQYGVLTANHISEIYNNHLVPSPMGDQVENVGEEISSQIETLQKVLNRSSELTNGLSSSLEVAQEEFTDEIDPKRLNKVVKQLNIQTNAIIEQNSALDNELRQSKAKMDELTSVLEAVREETMTDTLTSLGNRKKFDRSIERICALGIENNKNTSFIISDIDHFKKFNDTWGHQTGDQVLRLVSLAIKNNIKNIDIACRYGGEEFAIILPDTSLDQAFAVAERIRNAVASRKVIKRSTGEDLGRITLSAGIAMLRDNESVASLISRADECLYAAKRSGRNRSITEDDELSRDVA